MAEQLELPGWPSCSGGRAARAARPPEQLELLEGVAMVYVGEMWRGWIVYSCYNDHIEVGGRPAEGHILHHRVSGPTHFEHISEKIFD